jgi:hypothetical protein
VLSRLQDEAVVRPGFLSKAEEETLSRELEPELRRRRYEYDHWDAVVGMELRTSHMPSKLSPLSLDLDLSSPCRPSTAFGKQRSPAGLKQAGPFCSAYR